MNTKLIAWIVAILLGVGVITILWYVMSSPNTTPQTSEPTTTFPVSGSINTNTTGSTNITSATSSLAVQKMTITVQGGSTVVVNDFIHNGVTLLDSANTGNYLLAGNLGYCFSDPQKCQAAPSNNFSVYYNSASQSFVIDLTQEPIGQTRLDMENFMLTTLEITQQQMCSLNYLVGVTRYVNLQYVGKNLGFSFCPGATVLPK